MNPCETAATLVAPSIGTRVMVSVDTLPAPRSHFLTGHLPELRQDTLGFFLRCAREYGDAVTVRIGPKRALLLSSPALVEEVLVSQARHFAKSAGYRTIFGRLIGNGLVVSEGEEWRRQRRLVQGDFQRERVATYAGVMVQSAQRKLGAWHDDDVREIQDEMVVLSLDVVARALFGADLADDIPRVGRALAAVLHEFDVLLTGLQGFLPAGLPTPGNLRLRRAVRELDGVVFALIERRRRQQQVDRDDMLSRLLHARDTDGQLLSARLLRDQLMTLLVAGHETTALALTWTWYLLATNPAAEARLHAEVAEVLDGRPPTAADLPRLRYAEAVALEALRLYPPVYALARRVVEPCVVGGRRLPRGQTVVLSQWVVHRDPRSFEMPETFRPERWLDGLVEWLPRGAYFPFGAGQRMCVGNSFAMLELVLVLTTIAQRYRLELLPGQRVTPRPAGSLRVQSGLPMRLHRR